MKRENIIIVSATVARGLPKDTYALQVSPSKIVHGLGYLRKADLRVPLQRVHHHARVQLGLHDPRSRRRLH